MADPASTTCNLCKVRRDCATRHGVLAALTTAAAIGNIHSDFDDIMLDLAHICHNFEEESKGD